jgi:putative SOS response-associated peptidase YedK
MCARFALRRRLNLAIEELAEMLPVGLFDFDPEPAYNFGPTQMVAGVHAVADAGQQRPVRRRVAHPRGFGPTPAQT